MSKHKCTWPPFLFTTNFYKASLKLSLYSVTPRWHWLLTNGGQLRALLTKKTFLMTNLPNCKIVLNVRIGILLSEKVPFIFFHSNLLFLVSLSLSRFQLSPAYVTPKKLQNTRAGQGLVVMAKGLAPISK